jgi:hypothetical protein
MKIHQHTTKRSNQPIYSTKKGSLFWNKKGLFGEVMGSIGNFFQGILHIIPRPLIFLIFLFIILLLAQLLTYVFNIIGVYCTSGDIPMTIGFNPLKTAELIGQIPRAQDLGKEIINPNDMQGGIENCAWNVISGTYTLKYDNGTIENSSMSRWFYNGKGGCVDCTLVTVDTHGITQPEQWCITDAHRKPYNQKSTLAKWFCGGNYGRCEPPEHYYWQASSGQYICEDLTCTGITAGDQWDSILKEAGATPLYENAYGETQDVSHTAFVSIQCKDVRPKLTLYGIDIFNLEYWLILMLIAVMLWVLKEFL